MTMQATRKPQNANIGTINCAHCGEKSNIRKYSTGSEKLYYVCEGCGIIRPNLQRGQDYILDNGIFFGANGEPEKTDKKPGLPVVEKTAKEISETSGKGGNSWTLI